MIKQLKHDGLNFKKFNTTLENLYNSNQTIEFYVKKWGMPKGFED